MLIEILNEFVAIYRRWHERNRTVSRLLLVVVGLVAAKLTWVGVLWLASFANAGTRRHAVAGFVTWQGEPLEVGIISFRPLEQQPFDSGGMIQRGRFRIPGDKGLLPGKYRVRIHASMADPSLPPPPQGERDTRPGVEILPAKYNTASELTAEIGGWGRSTVSFDLSP